MANTISTTRHKSILAAHICSRCGSPVLHLANIHVKVIESYGFSSEYAISHVKEVAEAQFRDTIELINSARTDRSALLKLVVEENNNLFGWKKDDDASSTVWVTDLFSACPRCNHTEPWRVNESDPEMKPLTEKNFPHVYENISRAELWALMELQRIKDEVQAVRADESLYRAVRDEYQKAKQTYDYAQSVVQDTSLKAMIAEAEAKKAKLDQELDATGFFAFKARKEIESRLEPLRDQISDLYRQERERMTQANQTINECNAEFKRLAPFFVTGEMARAEVIVSENAVAYQLI